MTGHFKDLRSYLSALEKIGEVQPIGARVELDLEIGAISRRAGETGQAAPLFEKSMARRMAFACWARLAACPRNPARN